MCRYRPLHPAAHRAISPGSLPGAGEGPGRRRIVDEFHCGAVEFMTRNPVTGGMQAGVDDRDRVAVTEGESLGEPRRTGEHTAHRHSVEIVDQIGEAGALGVNRRAARDEIPDLLADKIVGREFGGELLGEPAGQHQRVCAGRQRLGQRVELCDARSGAAQQLGVLGIAEAEGLTRGQGHRDIGHRLGHRAPRFRRDVGTGGGHQRREIDVPRHQRGHRGHRVTSPKTMFHRGDQPEMP
ncbi:hypothetical protein BN970_06664 [Mycolicibacterium conceptionense]|uniref:Uncharacterized protein n=1 Tax=Mycolicibacterium conceptionense TaxID=451644 RepID=A0A0U1DY15_9MYCO|nr:hypothetical protein BN970_06664 [Mycolicibacterium conceptionense]